MTIRKRGSGWQVIVYAGLDPLGGRQRQLTRQVNGSRRQAEKLEACLRTEVADGQHAGTRVKTLGELLDPWIERRAASDQRLSANRVRDVHVILSGALGLAARWGWIPFNPALMVRPAGGKGKSRPVPIPEQVWELFGALADEPDLAVFLRLNTTAGLRPSEVCALRWLEVDLDQATVNINGSIVTAKSLPQKYTRKDSPKSVHSERLLALDAATAELLWAHRARCEQLAGQLDGRLEPQAHVFARTPDGRTPWRPDTVSKWFTALVRRLGHDDPLYGLRHFMATQLGAVAEAGTVPERMGHGGLAVTSGYMHRVSDADRAAAEYMGTLLGREDEVTHQPGPPGPTTLA